MIEQNGETYTGPKFLKSLVVASSKDGKTAFLVASALGLLPWQKSGGLVSRPSDLHLITFDSAAFGGVKEFLSKTCNASTDALKQIRLYNFEDDAKRVSTLKEAYDSGVFNTLITVQETIRERAARERGCPVVIMSSLTGVALTIERAIVGPPGKGKGYGDMSKWKQLSAQLFEVQRMFQVDEWHCFWEGHIYKPSGSGQAGQMEVNSKETLQVAGKAGANWAYNCEQVFRLRREYGNKAQGTKCDRVHLETRPTLDFISNGRNFNELLADKEPDLVEAAKKLKTNVGGWTATKGGAVAPKK